MHQKRILQFFKNVSNPFNWYYFIQGKLRKKLNKQSLEDVQKAMWYSYRCPSCYENNECQKCFCEFTSLILSNKQCDGKLENNN